MKKILVSVVAAALAVAFFTGCQKKSSSSGITLEMYYYKQENQEGLKNIVKAFEKSNPGIKINTLITPNDGDSQMSARAAQGDLPDILQIQSYSRVREYASKGYLVDLSKTEAISRVLPSSLPAVSYDGKAYALPTDYAGIGIIYNKDIFDKVGVKAPQTFRELEDVCEKLEDAGIVPFAALLKENWSVGHFITMVHTALLKEKNIAPADFVANMGAGKSSYGVVDTAKLFNILDFYRANMNKTAAEMGGGEQQQSFAKGESAMMVQGLWSYADAKKLNPNLNAGFIPFPVYNDPKMNTFYADVDSTFAVSSQSTPEKTEAALKFINWLTSSEGQALWVGEYKLIPPFKGVDVSSFGGPYVDLMKSVEEKGSMPWAFSQYPSDVFEGACKNGAQQYMMQKKAAADVIKTIDSQWADSVNK
ncbi:MAG: ABC transporter substrate-binding protein [Treponema sp.]